MTEPTYAQIHATPPSPIFHLEIKPPMSALCKCGARYGMHRVKDYACPHPNWRPGNGLPQWLVSTWDRA
jgi:hypothetical protein